MTQVMDDTKVLIQTVSKAVQVKVENVNQVISLLNEGNTVPFIARYRKEQTGGLDEVQIKDIQDTYEYGLQLNNRKEEVIRLIDEQGKLTPELQDEITKATKLQKVEDLYRPYKQKRRTRATIAKEKGLEPFASQVWQQEDIELYKVAKSYLSEEHELHTVEDVIAGVNDILAELISDDPAYREAIRKQTFDKGIIQSAVKDKEKDEKGIFEMYYEYQEPVRNIAAHRVLALNRGEKEEIIKVSIIPPVETILSYLQRNVIKRPKQEIRDVLVNAIDDSYKRLIQPSIEREVRNSLSETGEEQAIDVFSKNLRNLLLQPPLKGKTLLGVDPAYRTGCKLSVVDETGKVHAINVIYPTPPKNDKKGAEENRTTVNERLFG